MPEKSPYEQIRERNEREEKARQERVSKTKQEMRYMLLPVSKRLYAIIEFVGIGYNGDWKLGNGYATCYAKIVEGCEKLCMNEAHTKYKELVLAEMERKGKHEPKVPPDRS